MNANFYRQIILVLFLLATSLSGGAAQGQLPAPDDRYQQYQEVDPTQPYTPPAQVTPPAQYPATQVPGVYPSAAQFAPNYQPPYSTAQAIPATANYSAPVMPVSHPVLAPPVAEVSKTAELAVESSSEEEVIAEIDESEIDDVEYWYEPGYWFPRKLWSGGAEVGLSGTEGNAQSFSMRGGLNAKRETDRWINSIDLIYNRANSSGVVTSHNALFTANNDIKLGDSPWTGFMNLILEYDEFRAFDLRVAVNGGVGYQLIKTDSASLIGRFGSGGSTEIGAVDDTWVAEAVFGMEYEHQITERQKVSLKVDYFPEWTAYENYRMLTDASWEMLLHEASNLSLKVSAIDRYDSTPAGARPNDIDYALLLLWKL